MNYSKTTLVKVSLVLLALATTSKALATALVGDSILLAQSPSPTAFPLPRSLPSGTTMKVDGSTSMTAINEALKQRFEQKFPGAQVDLAATGTDAALKALVDGTVDLAAVGRLLTNQERAQGLVDVPVSREKIAIIVGPDNPFKGNLTFEQFARMFRGEITDWSQVGGAPGPIRFIDRPDFSDTRRALSPYKVFQGAKFATGANATQVSQDETAAVVQELGKDGISYAIASQVLNQPNVRVLPMHQTLPDDPRYPFSQPRGYVYNKAKAAAGTLNPGIQAFLGFATSQPGQEAIAEAKQTEAEAVRQAEPTASPAPVVSPEATAPSPAVSPDAALVPAPTETTPVQDRGGFPWWLLLLPLLGLGALAWWLKGRGGAAPPTIPAAATPVAGAIPDAPLPDAAIPPVTTGVAPVTDATATAPVTPTVGAAGGMAAAGLAGAALAGAGLLGGRSPDKRMILVPRNSQVAYAYWEVPEAEKAALRDEGGRQLALRLHDVTDIDMDRQPPHSTQQFHLHEADTDLHVPIAAPNRDYLAEVGYVKADGQWLSLVRSAHVRVPEDPGVLAQAATPSREMGEGFKGIAAAAGGAVLMAGAAGAALLGQQGQDGDESAATLGSPAMPQSTVPTESRIILVPRDSKSAYAYWEAPEVQKASLRDEGGRQFALRLHDVTAIDMDRQPPHTTQQFPLSEVDTDLHVPIAAPNRDYLVEVGYLTEDDRWLRLARSTHIHVSANNAGGIGGTLQGMAATLGMGLAGAGLAGAGLAAASTLGAPLTTNEGQVTQGDCAITSVSVHSKNNCYVLDAAQQRKLQQETATSTQLQPGTYLVRIKQGAFGYETATQGGEPMVLLWVYGGRLMNKKTNVEVETTWSSLNGYDEILTLEILEPATLSAFFLDSHLQDNEGEVTLSVVRL